MILVTGAGGLLGGHVVDALVAHGDLVRAMLMPGEDPSRLRAQGVNVCYGDLRDISSLTEATRGATLVFNCAAKTGPWGPQDVYEAINVRGVEALARAAMAAGASRVVHVSSIVVHGNEPRGVVDETTPYHHEPNPYTHTKIAGERALWRLIEAEGAPVTIVRPGLIYGPRDANSFGRFAALIARGKMPVMGSGDNAVPLIYVSDVAQGMLLAGAAPGAQGRAYLLVNDEPVTQNGYLSAIADALGVAPPRTRIPYRLALAAATAAELVSRAARLERAPLTRFGVQAMGAEGRFSGERARRELGFQPQVSLQDGVRRSVAWYQGTQIPQPSDASGQSSARGAQASGVRIDTEAR
ncbi:MAG TPA: NAD-dependent epimerase/dehydratase family protein [Ktedonobacterales bacterium]